MTRNYMKEVANLLGVELGEEFKIKGFEEYVYRFGDNYLFAKADGRNEWFKTNLLEDLLNGAFEIEKPILTEKEKEYLSNIIKPFKKERNITITKYDYIGKCEIIRIALRHKYFGYDRMILPKFAKDTMYKGMKPEKEYTPEELGL